MRGGTRPLAFFPSGRANGRGGKTKKRGWPNEHEKARHVRRRPEHYPRRAGFQAPRATHLQQQLEGYVVHPSATARNSEGAMPGRWGIRTDKGRRASSRGGEGITALSNVRFVRFYQLSHVFTSIPSQGPLDSGWGTGLACSAGTAMAHAAVSPRVNKTRYCHWQWLRPSGGTPGEVPAAGNYSTAQAVLATPPGKPELGLAAAPDAAEAQQVDSDLCRMCGRDRFALGLESCSCITDLPQPPA